MNIQKDLTRVQDIISKSMWDRSQMITLAVTMSKLITTKEKALNRARASEEILGKSNILSIIFYSRASELGIKQEDIVKDLMKPASQRPIEERYKSTVRRSKQCSVLPSGSLNFNTGMNKYFNVKENGESVIEIYKVNSPTRMNTDLYKAVITSGTTPIHQIGTYVHFVHDQNFRDIFVGEMVDYIEHHSMDSLVTLYGQSIPCYVYK